MDGLVTVKTSDKLFIERAGQSVRGDKSAVIRVDAATYGILLTVAGNSNLPIAQVARRMIAFANEHIEYVDSE